MSILAFVVIRGRLLQHFPESFKGRKKTKQLRKEVNGKCAKTRAYCALIMADPTGSCSVVIGGHTTSEGRDFCARRKQEKNVCVRLLMNVLILERMFQKNTGCC